MSTMTSAPSTRVRRPAAVTREHLLDVAEDLFYRYGIHVTGVDTIADRAGVAPTTLYRLFGSKDELVAAYVERYAAGYQGWIESITSDSASYRPESGSSPSSTRSPTSPDRKHFAAVRSS